MATVDEIQALYDAGRIQQAMNAVRAEVFEERRPDDAEIGKLNLIRAWCHWRRQEWDDARQWLQDAEQAGGAELQCKRLRAYFAAYRDKEDAVLRSLAQELRDDLGVQNALVIRARDTDSSFTHLDLEKIIDQFPRDSSEAAANLRHNIARFFLAKPRDQGDLHIALGMVELAIRLYGPDVHWHHRAAANFWRSHILERLHKKEEALEAAYESVQLWERAVELDPQNKGFQQNLENARKRAREL